MRFKAETTELNAGDADRPRSLHQRAACLVVIAGPDLGRLYIIADGDVTIGRDNSNRITVMDDAVSREHARLLRVDEDQFRIKDLGSTNGTFCNGDRIDELTLSDGDRIMVGTTTVLKFCFHDGVEITFQEHMFNSTVRDWLTQSYNRRYFDSHLDTECIFAARHQTSLSLVFFDIDHFKAVNDEYGHFAGDEVLKAVATGVADILRAEEFLARYGGEEFAIVARNTGLDGARVLAERCRDCVEKIRVDVDDQVISVTVSAGVATFDGAVSESNTDLLERADAALYRAKANGRNRVELETP